MCCSNSANDYCVYSANPGALNPTENKITFVAGGSDGVDGLKYELGGADPIFMITRKAQKDACLDSNYTRLDIVDCINAYDVPFLQTSYGNVFLTSNKITIRIDRPWNITSYTPDESVTFIDNTNAEVVKEFFKPVLDYTQMQAYGDYDPWMVQNYEYNEGRKTMDALKAYPDPLAPIFHAAYY